MGTEIQALKLTEEDFRGERFRDSRPRPQGQQRPSHPHAARRGARHPSALLPRRRRHRRDQHLFRHRDRAGRLRPGGDRLRAQPRRRAPRPRGGDPGRRRRTAAAASSPAPSARPTARCRSRPTSTIPATAPSPSMRCATPMPSRCAGSSTAAPRSSSSRRSSTRSTPRPRSSRPGRSSPSAASSCRS